MIELGAPLEVKPNGQYGDWELCFYVGDAFDYTTPFRAMLGEITDGLGQDRQNDLKLPPYEMHEDFVEGTLQFGNATLRVYYEHSLSFLVLMNESEGTLREVAERIQGRVQLV